MPAACRKAGRPISAAVSASQVARNRGGVQPGQTCAGGQRRDDRIGHVPPCRVARSVPRAAISRARPPRATTQAATLAACPPTPDRGAGGRVGLLGHRRRGVAHRRRRPVDAHRPRDQPAAGSRPVARGPAAGLRLAAPAA
jgi:hypothetical protein